MRLRARWFWLSAACWFCAGAALTTTHALGPDMSSLLELLVPFAVWVTLGTLTSSAILSVARRVRAADGSARRITLLVALGVAVGTALMAGSLVVLATLLGGAPPPPQAMATLTLFVGSTFVVWSLGGMTAAQVLRAHARERQRLAAEAETTRARLSMLRYQLHPHFLFNALNSLASAIDEDSERAQRMLLDLSQLLREALGVESDEGTLGRELERLEVYLRIERARFEDELCVTSSVPDELLGEDCLPLLLQPLVENAIKHGRDGGGVIDVRLFIERVDDRIRVLVRNRRAPVASASSGIGLANVRERLTLRYGQTHVLENRERGAWFEVETSWPVAAR